MKFLFLIAALCLTLSAENKIDFSYEVRPLLSKYCFACHGPDKAKGKLRLDTEEGIRKAVKAGDFHKSELMERILTDDEDDAMPPPETGKKVKESDIALLKKWITQGASFGGHWSFKKLTRPEVPELGGSHPVDNFVKRKLKDIGLKSSISAPKHKLIRRLSLDIRGIIPSRNEVEEFLNDNSPKAYENLVDKFLESSLYGEKWASKWLDLARYADTKGYEKDKHRDIWRYRDWVIKAVNDDMPFDEFTVKQVAGDMLQNASQDDILATAFHRNTMTNEEGGTDDEEFRTEAVKDRLDTTGLIWFGLSFTCAKCHTHKYDPVAIEDYYSMYAFLNQTEDADNEVPMVHMPTAEQKKKFDKIKAELDPLIEKRKKAFDSPDVQAAHKKWQEDLKKNPPKKNQRKKPDYNNVHPELKKLTAQINQLQRELNANRGPLTPIMKELPSEKHRPNYVHDRGFFLNKGETVKPDTPSFLHEMDKKLPRNRLGFAKWLINKENPLAARVAANRVWGLLFGKGIVETEEDFGNQGAMPTHPDLLDWLAVEFMDNSWSRKKLIKTIVLSATYRQTSRITPQMAEKDKFNYYYARGPRFRMTAEMIRDSALSASGLLSQKMYGPSVMPYQPSGLWKSTYNKKKWVTSKGEDKYRRALYTYMKRTSPYPTMTTFDAPSREICTARRIRSNTPLQALVTLNDPVFIEAAQAFARKLIKEEKTFEGRLNLAYLTALSRKADQTENQTLKTLLEERLKYYQKNLDEARRLAEVPLGKLPADIDPAEAAAWTSVCNVILNLDEFLTKE